MSCNTTVRKGSPGEKRNVDEFMYSCVHAEQLHFTETIISLTHNALMRYALLVHYMLTSFAGVAFPCKVRAVGLKLKWFVLKNGRPGHPVCTKQLLFNLVFYSYLATLLEECSYEHMKRKSHQTTSHPSIGGVHSFCTDATTGGWQSPPCSTRIA